MLSFAKESTTKKKGKWNNEGNYFSRRQWYKTVSADQSNIKAGDILLKVDDKEVTDVNTLKSIMFGYNLGDEATLKINRNGKEMDVKIKFTSMNKN